LGTLKKLAGQTAIYGFPTILGRLLNYLLVPLQTHIFAIDKYGIVGELYAWTALIFVILTFGMETTFFRFSQDKENREKTFSIVSIFLLITSAGFILIASLFSQNIADYLKFPQHPEYILYMAFIVGTDAFTSVHFARFRLIQRPIKFAAIKFTNIFINIFLNVFFLILCPYLEDHHIAPQIVGFIFNREIGIGYIFIANLVASIVTLLILVPDIIRFNWKFDYEYFKRMIRYAFPLVIFGLATIVNDTMNRIFIKNFGPEESAQGMVGIFNACFKISFFMTIFIQAFKYAAEPFFFSKANDIDAKKTYSEVMNIIVIICSLMFLGILLYMDIVKYFVGPDYRVGLGIVPILLLANLFSAILYNLSIWYKLSDKTIYGGFISIFGAIITVTLNITLIPRYGFMGAAWASFFCYFSMMVASYYFGQKYYRVNYPIFKIIFYILLAILFYYISKWITISNFSIRMIVHTLILFLYTYIVIKINPLYMKNIKRLIIKIINKQ
jgi:O-antigen/teichoic acid export membrane protein